MEDTPTRWGKAKASFSYLHHGHRVASYGGKLTENVTQAVCRDLLADALLRIASAGLDIVLHVHDEIVVELENEGQLAGVEALMCRVPRWAAGLPLRAEGYCSARYRK